MTMIILRGDNVMRMMSSCRFGENISFGRRHKRFNILLLSVKWWENPLSKQNNIHVEIGISLHVSEHLTLGVVAQASQPADRPS
jgi:hypothetical protein